MKKLYVWTARLVLLAFLVWALPNAVAFAVSIHKAVLSGVLLSQVTAQGGTQPYNCDASLNSPVDTDGPWPRCHIPAAATLTEIGCINKALIVAGIADAGGDGTVLIDNDVSDFALMGIDSTVGPADIIRNLTKGVNCTVTAVDGLTGDASNDITCSGLSGGNTFATGDEYEIVYNDATVQVKLYKTNSNGWRNTTQFGDTINCSVGRGTITTISGPTSITAGDDIEFDYEVTGSENPTWLHVWLVATPS